MSRKNVLILIVMFLVWFAIIAVAVYGSETVNQRTMAWCVEQHPYYSEENQVICQAAMYRGWAEGYREAHNQPNTNWRWAVEKDEVVECGDKEEAVPTCIRLPIKVRYFDEQGREIKLDEQSGRIR